MITTKIKFKRCYIIMLYIIMDSKFQCLRDPPTGLHSIGLYTTNVWLGRKKTKLLILPTQSLCTQISRSWDYVPYCMWSRQGSEWFEWISLILSCERQSVRIIGAKNIVVHNFRWKYSKWPGVEQWSINQKQQKKKLSDQKYFYYW